jgi:hypothetical protein
VLVFASTRNSVPLRTLSSHSALPSATARRGKTPTGVTASTCRPDESSLTSEFGTTVGARPSSVVQTAIRAAPAAAASATAAFSSLRRDDRTGATRAVPAGASREGSWFSTAFSSRCSDALGSSPNCSTSVSRASR